MITLTVSIPENETDHLEQFVNKLGGEVIAVDGKKRYHQETIISKVEEGLEEIKAYRTGKSKGLNLDDVLGQ